MAAADKPKEPKEPKVEDMEDEEQDEQQQEMLEPPLPPDGGWGWVIVAASFVTNVLVDGVCFSFGIFYLEFLESYGESKAMTSWVGSVLNGMYLSMGPVVSALANKFGCRAVTIAGSILAAAAFFLSTYSPDVPVLIFLYGGMGGLGFGLMYLPAIVMVGFYFEKRRAFATGIAVCGSGIGAFVFAPLCRTLLDVYGWKGATWIIAGLVLNGAVCGALFRPLESTASRKKSRVTANTVENGNGMKTIYTPDDITNEKVDCKSLVTDGSANDTFPSKPPLNPAIRRLQESELSRMTKSHGNLCANQMADNGHKTGSAQIWGSWHGNMDKASGATWRDEKEEMEKLRHEISRPFYRKDVFYFGSVHHLPDYQLHPNDYIKSVTSIPRGSTDHGSTDTSPSCLQSFKSMTSTLSTMMDFSLLKDPIFCLYGLSCFLCMSGFFIPFVYLPDHGIQVGLTKENAGFLISILGITNTVGRVACGWISDQPWADCLLINNMALIMGGVATICVPFCNSFGLLAAYSCVFGVGIAVFVALRSIIMVELLGLEKLTNAFGMVTMCQGLSAFIGAPIAGALFDATGNYKYSFYMAGVTVALAGVICLPLRRIAKWRENKQKAQNEVATTKDEYSLVNSPTDAAAC